MYSTVHKGTMITSAFKKIKASYRYFITKQDTRISVCYTEKNNYKIPIYVLTKPSWAWNWVNYSRPGRVL